MSLVEAALIEQRRARPEVEWIAAPDFAGRGLTVIVAVLPSPSPAVYDGWPWSALAGFQRTRRELRELTAAVQAEAR